MEPDPDISICIATRGRPDLVRHQIMSVVNTAGPISCEIMVMDDQAPDEAQVLFDREFPEVVVYECAGQETLVQARNRALEVAGGRYILLCDPGTIIQPGCISRLLEFMDDNPLVGLAGPGIIRADHTILASCQTFGAFFRSLPKTRADNIRGSAARKILLPSSSMEKAVAGPVNLLHGACLLIRRETHVEIGFLNERLAEEPCYIEYCLRAQLAGWHVFYVPAAAVLLLGDNYGNDAENRFKFWRIKSMVGFLLKKRFSLIR